MSPWTQLWTILGQVALALLVVFLVAASVVVIIHVCRLGPTADWVEAVRATILPPLDGLLEWLAGGPGAAYDLGEREVVGVIDADPECVEALLWQAGCRRNVVAASKTLAGRREIGSWVLRDPDVVGERMQVHVMLFEGESGTVVCAHREYASSLRWLWRDWSVLRKHYQGAHYSPREGAQIVRESLLEDVDWGA